MRATSSLPVPDSRQMCTGGWLRATRAIMSRSCSMTVELPSRRAPCKLAAVRSSAPARSLIALPTSLRNTPRSRGLETKSNAPSLSARTADSMLPWAVITATGTLALRSEEHTSELQSHLNLVCRLLLEKKKNKTSKQYHVAKILVHKLAQAQT